MSKISNIIIAALSGILISLFIATTPASAHIDFKVTNFAPGSHVNLTLEVADGCANGDTTQVDILIPDSLKHLMVTGVKLGKASAKGWSMKVATASGKTTIRAKGPAVKVSDAKPLNLNFMASLPTGKNQSIKFPTTQYCGKEINYWSEPRPSNGAESVEGSYPVPTLTTSSKASKEKSMHS